MYTRKLIVATTLTAIVAAPALAETSLNWRKLLNQPTITDKSGVGIYLFHDRRNFRITTVSDGTNHVIAGTVQASPGSKVHFVRRIDLEANDKLTQQGNDSIMFSFHTSSDKDGFSFWLRGTSFTLTGLTVDGKPATGEQVHLGPDATVAESLPVVVTRPATKVNFALIDKGTTGLILIAKGAEPGMSPSIVTDRGEDLLANIKFPPEMVEGEGIAEWTQNQAKAKADPRAGGHPLVVRARVNGKGDMIVSTADAKRIKAAQAANKVLEQGRLVIVY